MGTNNRDRALEQVDAPVSGPNRDATTVAGERVDLLVQALLRFNE